MTRTSAATRSKPAMASAAAAPVASSGKAKTRPETPSSVRIGRGLSGLGLFAARPFAKGERIIEYVGVMLDDDAYRRSRSAYLFDVGGKGALDGSPRWNIARYINHSCRPNCEPEIKRRRVFIHARRDIKEGEELSYNYGDEYFNEHIGEKCRCPKCTERKAAG